MCAGKTTQAGQAIFFEHHWRWIVRAWVQASGDKPKRDGPGSQSTVSRVLSTFKPRFLANLMTAAARKGFSKEWRDYVAKAKKIQKARRERLQGGNLRVRRRTYTPALKKKPQFCLDGKSRSGCISALTGRTEIDLTIFSPETSQIVGHVTLPDKVGEQTAAPLLIFTVSDKLPRGIFTGDAGITSPNVVGVIVADHHGYLLAVKGNAGKVYKEMTNYDWAKVRDKELFFSEGHGRREIRTILKVPVAAFGSTRFEKYADATAVYAVIADIHHVKEDKFTTETRFFIADSIAAALSRHEALTYIRDHWAIESFHWVKDVVLGEDDCPTKNSNGSQTLGLMRTALFKVGKSVSGSVAKFIYHFSSDPEQVYKRGL